MTSSIWEISCNSPREGWCKSGPGRGNEEMGTDLRCNLEVELTELHDWLNVAFGPRMKANYNPQFLAQITEKMSVLCMMMSYEEEGTNYKEKNIKCTIRSIIENLIGLLNKGKRSLSQRNKVCKTHGWVHTDFGEVHSAQNGSWLTLRWKAWCYMVLACWKQSMREEMASRS